MRDTRELVLFGAGGMGKETIPLIDAINLKGAVFHLLGFAVDHKYYRDGMRVNGYPVLGDEEWLTDNKDRIVCCCTIGDPLERRAAMERLEARGIQFVSLIHPYSWIDKSVSIGRGSVIQYRCMVSVDTVLGKGCFLNSDAVVGHDCIIDDYVTLYPRTQISGRCRIGEGSMIGAMSFINERLTVGKEAVVGAGSVVFTRVKDKTRVLGNPAHKIEL